MKEAAITHSPHAFVPKKNMSAKERDELYRTRLDESYKPYTVIDVLKKVYHRDFSDDLMRYVGAHPEEFRNSKRECGVSRVWVNQLKIVRPESVFFQPAQNFLVDILVDTRIRLEEVQCGNSHVKAWIDITPQVRLRYRFDFIPCHLDCHFIGVVTDEKESLVAQDPYRIPADKYLLPVLKSDDDYRRIARYLMYAFKLRCRDSDIAFDPMEWLNAMGVTVRQGVFQDGGVLGEYFFSFGSADIVCEKTGEVLYDSEINPGTIVINREILSTDGAKNTTLTHEGIHHFLAYYYFMLQRTHGHQFCSYMCKRFNNQSASQRESDSVWTPVNIMEVQANKTPGFLMIQDGPGREHAAALLKSYGGERSIANMRSLVDDMAEYYKTTKTVARTRLLDFGYTEVQGILQSANGDKIPPYKSELPEGETYTIDEADGIREYIRNPEFRKILDTGDYVYVEGHYCLNHKDYVRKDHLGNYHLTSEARHNMDRCCLVFRREYQNRNIRTINGILRKGTARGAQSIIYVKKDGTSAVTDAGRERRARLMKEKAAHDAVFKPFNQMTVDLMDSRGVTKEKLAEDTGLSVDTIQKMRNRPDRAFSIREVIAVAIALHLEPEISEEYIKRCPSGYLDTDEMYCYQYELKHHYNWTVAKVNRDLVDMGYRPLTNLVEGYNEQGVCTEDEKQMRA